MKNIKYFFLKLFGKLRGNPVSLVPSDFSREERFKIPDFKFISLSGKQVSLAEFSGKKILIVNVASECGFTPQYRELQLLHQIHNDKIAVLAFPCNDFGAQEPGTAEEIQHFCDLKYRTTFLMFYKVKVRGNEKSELYKWLGDPKANGWNDRKPTWNFCKYLIDENGFLIGFFPSYINPLDRRILSE